MVAHPSCPQPYNGTISIVKWLESLDTPSSIERKRPEKPDEIEYLSPKKQRQSSFHHPAFDATLMTSQMTTGVASPTVGAGAGAYGIPDKAQQQAGHDGGSATQPEDLTTPKPSLISKVPMFPPTGAAATAPWDCDLVSMPSDTESVPSGASSTTSGLSGISTPTRGLLSSSIGTRTNRGSNTKKRKRGKSHHHQHQQLPGGPTAVLVEQPNRTSLIPHYERTILQENMETVQPALWQLCVRLRQYSDGTRGILPQEIDPAFSGCSFTQSCYDESASGEILPVGRALPPDVVKLLVKKSARARLRNQSEAVWTSQVTCPLLDHALETANQELRRKKNLQLQQQQRKQHIQTSTHYRDEQPGENSAVAMVENIICSSSTIDPRLLAGVDPPRRIDSMMAFSIGDCHLPREFEAAFRAHLVRMTVHDKNGGNPCQPLNPHWDRTIQEYLSIIPIEIKKLGKGQKESAQQITVWQRAFWRYLSFSIYKRLHAGESTVAGSTSITAAVAITATAANTSIAGMTTKQQDAEAIYAETCNLLAKLPFLPGLIVRGDSWEFVAMTADFFSDPMITTMWGRLELGNSSTELGCHKIAACLQLLVAWSHETFWPWFLSAVLGLKSN